MSNHKQAKELGNQQTIILEILHERDRQDDKFGEQNLNPFLYGAILGEEVGEFHKAVIDAYDFNTKTYNKELLKDYRTELVQVAAVAVAMIECFDTNKWE